MGLFCIKMQDWRNLFRMKWLRTSMDITAFTRNRSRFDCILFGYIASTIATLVLFNLVHKTNSPNRSSFPLIIIAHTSRVRNSRSWFHNLANSAMPIVNASDVWESGIFSMIFLLSIFLSFVDFDDFVEVWVSVRSRWGTFVPNSAAAIAQSCRIASLENSLQSRTTLAKSSSREMTCRLIWSNTNYG